MNKTLNKHAFYFKPFLIISALNILFFVCIGTYLEDYEGLNCSVIQGLYTIPCQNFADFSNHFLIMRVYEYISRLFPNVPVYGVIMFIYNWISLTALGLVLYRILKVNILIDNILLFMLLYGVLSIDNMVNLSSTRITFIIIVSLFAYIESCRFESKNINNFQWGVLILLMLFAALMRAEAVLLFSLLYIGILVLNKRFYLKSLLPVLFGLIVFLSVNIYVTQFGSEAKKVAVYKEKEMLDRNNIDFDRLVPGSLLELEVQAFTTHTIFDKEHFTFAFYDSISASPSNVGLKSLADGIKVKAFLHTFLNSVMESYNCWRLLLYYILSCVLFVSIRHNIRRPYVYLMLGLFPLVVCLYTMVPLRFVNPFYSIAGTLNILLYLKYQKEYKKVLALGLFVFCLLWVYEMNCKTEYSLKSKTFHGIQRKLNLLSRSIGYSKPVIINKFDFDKMFPVDPLEKITPPDAIFLNFFYYNAYEFYRDRWRKVSPCNPLSLKEKTDYIVSSGNYFLVDDETFAFMQHYFEQKYHQLLMKSDISQFDNELNVCKLYYSNTPAVVEHSNK